MWVSDDLSQVLGLCLNSSNVEIEVTIHPWKIVIQELMRICHKKILNGLCHRELFIAFVVMVQSISQDRNIGMRVLFQRISWWSRISVLSTLLEDIFEAQFRNQLFWLILGWLRDVVHYFGSIITDLVLFFNSYRLQVENFKSRGLNWMHTCQLVLICRLVLLMHRSDFEVLQLKSVGQWRHHYSINFKASLLTCTRQRMLVSKLLYDRSKILNLFPKVIYHLILHVDLLNNFSLIILALL